MNKQSTTNTKIFYKENKSKILLAVPLNVGAFLLGGLFDYLLGGVLSGYLLHFFEFGLPMLICYAINWFIFKDLRKSDPKRYNSSVNSEIMALSCWIILIGGAVYYGIDHLIIG